MEGRFLAIVKLKEDEQEEEVKVTVVVMRKTVGAALRDGEQCSADDGRSGNSSFVNSKQGLALRYARRACAFISVGRGRRGREGRNAYE